MVRGRTNHEEAFTGYVSASSEFLKPIMKTTPTSLAASNINYTRHVASQGRANDEPRKFIERSSYILSDLNWKIVKVKGEDNVYIVSVDHSKDAKSADREEGRGQKTALQRQEAHEEDCGSERNKA